MLGHALSKSWRLFLWIICSQALVPEPYMHLSIAYGSPTNSYSLFVTNGEAGDFSERMANPHMAGTSNFADCAGWRHYQRLIYIIGD